MRSNSMVAATTSSCRTSDKRHRSWERATWVTLPRVLHNRGISPRKVVMDMDGELGGLTDLFETDLTSVVGMSGLADTVSSPEHHESRRGVIRK